MQLDTEDLSPTKKKVTITVPAPRVDSGFSAAYNQISQRVSLPGFRRGRVPMSHLRKRFGKQATADVTQALVEEGWTRALDDLAFVPVGMPDIDAEPAKQGKPYTFTVVVDVTPDIELLPYEGLTAETVTWTVGDGALDHELGHLREQVATWAPVDDRDVAESGDMVVIDYAGSIDGVPFDGGTSEDAELELGSGDFIPGFEEQIVGRKAGSDFDVNVSFPEDYQSEALAGAAAVFKCTLKEIKAKDIPEVGQELADRLGAEDIDAVKAEVRDQIAERYAKKTIEATREALREQISAQYDIPAPESLVEASLSDARGDVFRELMDEGRTYEEAAEVADARLEERRAAIEKKVRTELVLDRIAAVEDIEVPLHEVNAFIETMVRAMGQYGPRMRQVYKDSNRRAALRRRMRQDKTLDFLLTKADVTAIEREVPEDLGHDHA